MGTTTAAMKPLEALKLMREELEQMSGYWTERMSTLAQMADEAIGIGEKRAGSELPEDQREAYKNAARAEYGNDDVEIDEDAEFSTVEGEGSWVSGWLWVSNEDAGIGEVAEG